MGDTTAIEWTQSTWNPVTGCTKVSPGCDHCYAERVTERWYGKGSFEQVQLHPDRLDKPLHWRKPRKVFVNSMSDLFHDAVPDEFIADVWHVMAQTPQHTYQVLTKRHARMRAWVAAWCSHPNWRMPLPNVWLGVSVEDQKWAGIRIPALLNTPAAVRFLSCEPLLGPIDLYGTTIAPLQRLYDEPNGQTGRIDWVIVGGESGPGARPMDAAWAREIRDQCVNARVPFLFKQWGGRTPKAGGRLLDGRTWDEYPQVVTA